ncbi:hypothetical protein SCH01S_21_01050 [Sphingomonas changbaiensis NBRC 104936]|uniref:Uncharacterized protein n=1 Tax=Sphingomonas changbaiensis NBRC 104936 TaxID=1219043 RepID=A0A0E9MN49_9SPHN|nr:hypothetical protein SCH01S_21_01050 [Sphingomonas changbaiensis NBRC 104936]
MTCRVTVVRVTTRSRWALAGTAEKDVIATAAAAAIAKSFIFVSHSPVASRTTDPAIRFQREERARTPCPLPTFPLCAPASGGLGFAEEGAWGVPTRPFGFYGASVPLHRPDASSACGRRGGLASGPFTRA